ncbi:MAG: RdgB/HAM1 family non-canonical purine NTP pyrophosphatase [Calditrichaeota bacterium]|nr:RdgB/HAM1 family non-canonical purine NTP pyrophosphatase [Calditrichota bacterium]
MSRLLIIATRNPDKLREIAHFLQGLPVDLRGLAEFSYLPPVEEDRATAYENALKKAVEIGQHTKQWVLADDTALEVEVLKGAPGVHSARYSGAGATYESNVRKLLAELSQVPLEKRQALFRCVIALRLKNSSHLFEGILQGRIALQPRGGRGFGYDPVFELPDGRTLAEIDLEEKNRISHRAQALWRARQFLQSLLPETPPV